jgi:hypothetical protein
VNLGSFDLWHARACKFVCLWRRLSVFARGW